MDDVIAYLIDRYGEPSTWPDQHFGERRRETPPAVTYAAVPARAGFGNPVPGRIGPLGDPDPSGWVITRYYGDESMPQYGIHDGLDIANGRTGDPILAMDAGEVYQSFFDQASGGAGIIRIDYGDGWTGGYAHMDRLDVKVGQRVERGQQIGRLDSTGWVTGAHLHMDTSYQNARTDPWPLLEQNMSTTLPGYQDRIDNRQTRTTAPTNFRPEPNTSCTPIGQLGEGALIIPIARCNGTAVGTAADKTDWYANVKTEGLPGDEAYLGYVHSSTLNRTSDGKGVLLDPIEEGTSAADLDNAERAAADAVRDAGVSALNEKAKAYGA